MTILLPVINRLAAGARCSARRLPRPTSARLGRPGRTRASDVALGRPQSPRRQLSRLMRLPRLLPPGRVVRRPRGAAEEERRPLPETAPPPKPHQRRKPPAVRHPLQGPSAEERPGPRCAGHRLTSLGHKRTRPSTRCRRHLETRSPSQRGQHQRHNSHVRRQL